MHNLDKSKSPTIARFSVAVELKNAMERRRKALGFNTQADYMRHLIRQDVQKPGGFPFAVSMEDETKGAAMAELTRTGMTMAAFPKLLAWHYHDRESLKGDLLSSIAKYRNCPIPDNPFVQQRIKVYEEMVALCDQPAVEPGAQMVLPFAA